MKEDMVRNTIRTMENLDENNTKDHPDRLVRTYGLVHKLINAPYPFNGKYFSIPISKGYHISDDPRQKENLEMLNAILLYKASRGEGISVLVKADPGFGKTYWVANYLSIILV